MRRHLQSILFVFLLAACSGAPSERDGWALFEEQLRMQLGGTPFQITSFRKTDGQELNEMGAKGYRMFFQASAMFPQGHRVDELRPGFIPIVHQWAEPMRPGASVTYIGSIVFEKSERGWRATSVSLTNRSPPSPSQSSGMNEPTTPAWPPGQEALQNAPPLKGPPPPVQTASKAYRCSDNSLVYVDFFSNNTATVRRTTRTATPVTATAPDANSAYVGEGISVSGSGDTATINGKSCHT